MDKLIKMGPVSIYECHGVTELVDKYRRCQHVNLPLFNKFAPKLK
jgi:hypothetical protein